jgi:hypothetical protein
MRLFIEMPSHLVDPQMPIGRPYQMLGLRRAVFFCLMLLSLQLPLLQLGPSNY